MCGSVKQPNLGKSRRAPLGVAVIDRAKCRGPGVAGVRCANDSPSCLRRAKVWRGRVSRPSKDDSDEPLRPLWSFVVLRGRSVDRPGCGSASRRRSASWWTTSRRSVWSSGSRFPATTTPSGSDSRLLGYNTALIHGLGILGDVEGRLRPRVTPTRQDGSGAWRPAPLYAEASGGPTTTTLPGTGGWRA